MIKERLQSQEEFYRTYPVSFDHDGVIADTRSLVVEKVNEKLGTDYIAHDINSWHWVYEVSIEHGMRDNEAWALENELWYGETLLEAKPIPGALELRKWFVEKGIYAPTITSRNTELLGLTLEWYQTHMPFLPKKQIIINPSREMRGDWFKVFAIQNIAKSVIHFEDSLEHAKNILDYTDAFVVLLSQYSKLDAYQKERMLRVYSGDFGQPNLGHANKRLSELKGFSVSHNIDTSLRSV